MSKVIDNIEDINAIDAKAPLASPALTGTPTAPTATAGTDTTQLATTAFVKAKSEADSIGVNQTWQNVTASRSAGVTYTNSTGKPIVISVGATTSVASSNGLVLYIDGIVRIGDSNTGSAAGYAAGVIGIVPNGSTYSLAIANVTIDSWSELR